MISMFALLASSGVRVTAREWQWEPVLPPAVWIVLAAAAIALTASGYLGRRAWVSTGPRFAMLVLRSAAVLLVLILLLHPTIRRQWERSSRRPMALLIDRSGSMATRDEPDDPRTRWERAIASVEPIARSSRPDRVRFFSFDEQSAESDWPQLAATSEPSLDRHTDIAAALRAIRSATAGQPQTQIMLVSDGADTVSRQDGALLAAARELAREGLTLHTVVVGREDLPRLTVEPPRRELPVFINDSVRIPVRFTRQDSARGSVDVVVRVENRPPSVYRVTFPAGSTEVTQTLELVFDRPGLAHCRIEVPSRPPPVVVAGHPEFDVHAIDQPVRVLYIERQPRWSFQFLRNAFERDPRFDARLVLLDSGSGVADLPLDVDDWSSLDVVIVGDVSPQDLPPDWWRGLHDAVIDGGVGLIFAAGPGDLPARFLGTAEGELLPFRGLGPALVESREPFPLQPTPLGRHHPIMHLQDTHAWDKLPRLYWCAPVRDLKPTAEVLAEKPAGDDAPACPVVVVQRVGRGTVVYVGTDETWRWRYEVGNAVFYRFWAQAILYAGLPHRMGDAARHATTQSTQPAPFGELTDIRARPEVLKQLADETGGRCVSLTELPALIGRLEHQTVREEWSEAGPAWDNWPTLLVLVLLLSAEWWLRRRYHLP